jgi:hypothetical protein
MTKSQKQTMNERILKHGTDLNRIFNTGLAPSSLCKRLHQLEQKANRAATCLLNTNTLHLMELNQFTGYDVEQATEEQEEAFFNAILKSVYKILKPTDEQKANIFINYDARGYTLKIKSEYAKSLDIYKDFGGFGIIAPDFTPSN